MTELFKMWEKFQSYEDEEKENYPYGGHNKRTSFIYIFRQDIVKNLISIQIL